MFLDDVMYERMAGKHAILNKQASSGLGKIQVISPGDRANLAAKWVSWTGRTTGEPRLPASVATRAHGPRGS